MTSTPSVTGSIDAVRRWAAAHAASVTPGAARAAQAAADAPVPGLPREPVPAVLAAFAEVLAWDGAAGHINRVAWARHPDGQLLLATAAADGIARVWDPETGRQLHVLTGHRGLIGRAEWGYARGGRPLLATGSTDGTARIWDCDTGRCLHTLECRSPRALAAGSVLIAWGTGADGQPVLATGDQSGTTRIWDPGTGQELYAVPSEEPDSDPVLTSRAVYSMAWGTGASGQARLATARHRPGMLSIWDPGAGQLLYTSSADGTYDTEALAYARRADGRLVLATADTDTAHVWTEEDGTFTSESVPAVNAEVDALSWSPLVDGRLLLATSTDVAVHLWDGHTLDRLHTEELSFAVAGPGRLDWTVTPDGRLLLAAAATHGQIHIWDVALDPPVRPPATKAWPSSAAGSLASRQARPARLVLPPEEVTPQFPEAAQSREKTTVLACTTTPDGRTLLATSGDDADVHLWDLESGHHLRTLTGHSDAVRDVAWARTADGRLLLATASHDDTARIWNPDTGQELRVLTGHNDSVEAIAWGVGPDGTPLLATASNDRTARIWNPDTGQELRVLTGHNASVEAIAWGVGPDGTPLLATASNDGTRIWDPDTGQELRALPGHASFVFAAAWATRPDGTMLLATGSRDGTRIWDPATGQELRALPGPGQGSDGVFAVAWAQASDGRLLLATATNGTGTVQICDPATGDELASLPGTGSLWRSAVWTRDREGNLLLLLANPDPASGPVRAWLVETGTGGPTEPPPPGRPGTRHATREDRPLLRLGAAGLWLPLGLLADLITLTGTEDTPPDEAPRAGWYDARLAALADEPGIGRLRELAAGQPSWRPDARAAFAALLAADLSIPAQYTPPDDADPATLASALAAVLADLPGGLSAASWQVPAAELRDVTARITAQTITLLQILGPDACAADPLLPLRLAHYVPQLPSLSPSELRLLAQADGRRTARGQAAAVGTLTYSPGTVGVTRTGSLTRLLATQLALPADLLTTRLAENQLLFRQHRAPAPPAPRPLTLILDTTPPTYGPAGTALRLATHLITTTLWAHGHHPALITLGHPATPVQLHTPADLLAIWTATTLNNPGPPLTAARRTAATLGQPALLLTHHHTARDNAYPAGPATRLLTTHQPPEKPPAGPAGPWHAHLPPAPTQDQLITAIGRLLIPSTEDSDRAAPWTT
jgi:WD40 repeat protein